MNSNKLAHIPLLYPILIHGAFSPLLALSCWELEQCIEPHSFIRRSTMHLEIFLKQDFWKVSQSFSNDSLESLNVYIPYQGNNAFYLSY